MNPAAYDAWYDTPRGRWIGEVEFRLLERLLAAQPGETLLDVGCGTGWFTRRFAATGVEVTGIDCDPGCVAFARARPGPPIRYLHGDARHLPFPDHAFDRVVSVTALCFVNPWPQALAEIARVSRLRFAVGLLHRRSALWLAKGRDGGKGAYAGAHWHTRGEVRDALRPLPVRNEHFGYAVLDPSASTVANALERLAAPRLPLGSFLAFGADVAR